MDEVDRETEVNLTSGYLNKTKENSYIGLNSPISDISFKKQNISFFQTSGYFSDNDTYFRKSNYNLSVSKIVDVTLNKCENLSYDKDLPLKMHLDEGMNSFYETISKNNYETKRKSYFNSNSLSLSNHD